MKLNFKNWSQVIYPGKQEQESCGYFFFHFLFFLSIFIFRMVEGQIAFENKVFNIFLIHKNICHWQLNLLSLILIFFVSYLPIFMFLNKGEGFVVDVVFFFWHIFYDYNTIGIHLSVFKHTFKPTLLMCLIFVKIPKVWINSKADLIESKLCSM